MNNFGSIDQKQEKLISITGAEPTNDNRGFGALSFGALGALNAAYPDANVILLDYYKQEAPLEYELKGKKIFIERVGLRFTWKFYLKDNICLLILGALVMRILPFKIVKQMIFKLLPKLMKISLIDTAYIISGGDSFSDIYGLNIFMYVTLPQFLLLLMKVPVVQLPQTYGPFNNAFVRLLSGIILVNSKAIYARDNESLRLAETIISKKNAKKSPKLSYDVGFLLEPRDVTFFDSRLSKILSDSNAIVGINMSGLLLKGGYTGKNQFKLRVDYKEFSQKLVKLFLDKQCSILLIPHVFGNNYENDLSACEEIYSDFKDNQRVWFKSTNLDSSEIKGLIGKCNFFTGARMHACIGALSQSIPTAPLAYSRKFDGVLKTINIESCVVDLRTDSLGDALSKIECIFDNRNEISEHLKKLMPNVKQSIQNIFIQKSN